MTKEEKGVKPLTKEEKEKLISDFLSGPFKFSNENDEAKINQFVVASTTKALVKSVLDIEKLLQNKLTSKKRHIGFVNKNKDRVSPLVCNEINLNYFNPRSNHRSKADSNKLKTVEQYCNDVFKERPLEPTFEMITAPSGIIEHTYREGRLFCQLIDHANLRLSVRGNEIHLHDGEKLSDSHKFYYKSLALDEKTPSLPFTTW